MTYCDAASRLDPSDLVDLYWAGRCTLVTRGDHIAIYDRVFRSFFLGAGVASVAELLELTASASAQTLAVLNVPASEETGEEVGEETMLGLMASDAQTLRHKSFGACTPEELAAVRRIMTRIRLTPPKRKTRRTRPAVTGPSPTCAVPSERSCACTANRPSCTGGAGRCGCVR